MSAAPFPRKASLLPFGKLPNLPKPIIPVIDLGIGGLADIRAIEAPSISDQKRTGCFVTDGATQTDDGHIVEVKRVTYIIETLLQDVAQLRKDVNFAQHVLRADYESKLNHRATELYCRVNEKVSELEKQHKKKLEAVRGSYRQQLVNAIQKIAGEYKAYYDELMSGKTGGHDLRIQELRERVIEQEGLMEVQALRIEELTNQLKELEGQEHEETPLPTPRVSLEEAEELRSTIADLETHLSETTAQLAAKETAEKRLTHQLTTVSKELETERGKVAQLKRDMEGFKKKAKSDQEKATRMAESQRASLEKEMREKMKRAQEEAAMEAERVAEERGREDRATLELERERSRHREQELLARQSSVVATQQELAREEGELETELARLQLVEGRQREEISRLKKEIARVNRVWGTKLDIMKKNFHALRDESFLRGSLQRQSASLHHANLGYAVNGHCQSMPYGEQDIHSEQNCRTNVSNSSGDESRQGGGDRSVPPPPTPTPRNFRAPPREAGTRDSVMEESCFDRNTPTVCS